MIFNLVRSQKEKKSNGVIEIKDPSRKFTWTNNHECPIMTTLDRILVLMEWEAKYPMAKVNILPKEVSDHNPVLINWGEGTETILILSLGLRNGG
jgi:endonuclease/exonuclease/phosphatase family metal-dependent hydrolase